MKPIRSLDALFRCVSDVVQVQTAPHIGECGVEGRTQVNSQNGLDTHSFFWTLKLGECMVMIDSLREIYIKICSARIVMYSQRHVC